MKHLFSEILHRIIDQLLGVNEITCEKNRHSRDIVTGCRMMEHTGNGDTEEELEIRHQYNSNNTSCQSD
jgi:hypothetical protein